MLLVRPYKTLSGALRALDNGGRFYNLFTHAGDQIVTAAELKKVAGVIADDQSAASFFELAIAELDGNSRQRILKALGPRAREIHRRHRPERLGTGEFRAKARAGRSYLLEGRVRKFDDVTVTGMILIPMMTGKVTTMIPIPTQDRYTVYELDGPAPDRECLVLTPKQSQQLRGRYRFAGVAKEAQVGKGTKKAARVRLEPRYYSPA